MAEAAADGRGRAGALRQRQRRLRRPRRARGGRGPRPDGADVDLRRQQARRRGDPGGVRRDVRLHRPRLPVRQRGRPAARPTASASTSCAGCSTTRPGCGILGDGQQSKSYIYVEDVIEAVLLAGSLARHPVRRVQRRHRRLRHRHRDRRARDAGARASSRARRRSTTPAATAAGRATCRWSGSRPARSARSAGPTSAPGPEALRDSMTADGRRGPRGAARGHDRPAAPSSSTATGCSTASFVEDGVPVPPRRRDGVRAAAGCRRGVPVASRTPGWRWSSSPTSRTWPAAPSTPAELDAMHRRLRAELPLDDIVVSARTTATTGCWCRKPRPGMILDAARRLGLDLDHSVGRRATAGATSTRPTGPASRRSGSTGGSANRSGTRRTHVLALSPRRGIMSCRCAAPTAPTDQSAATHATDLENRT